MTKDFVYRFIRFSTPILTKYKAGNNIPEILDAYLSFFGKCITDYHPQMLNYKNIQGELFTLYRSVVVTGGLQSDTNFIESFIELMQECSTHGTFPELQPFANHAKLWLRKCIRRSTSLRKQHDYLKINTRPLLKLPEHAAAEFCSYALDHLQAVDANPWTMPRVLRLYIDFFDQALASGSFLGYLYEYETELEIQFHQLTPSLEIYQSRPCMNKLLADPTFRMGILERSDLSPETIALIQTGLTKMSDGCSISDEDIVEFTEEILPILDKYQIQKHEPIIKICIKLFRDIRNDPALSFDHFDRYYEKAAQALVKFHPSAPAEKILNKALDTPTGKYLTSEILEELENNDIDDYELNFCAELRNFTQKFLISNISRAST